MRDAARERRKDERGREKGSEGEKREEEGKIAKDRERQIERNTLYKCVIVLMKNTPTVAGRATFMCRKLDIF